MKKALTIPEQIFQLKQRGMLFRDEDEAKNILKKISYYRLSAYWWEHQEDDKKHIFKAHVYFEESIYFYNFDKELKLILFNCIETLEIALRTKMIYYLSINYGPLWYENEIYFNDTKKHLKTLSKIYTDASLSSEEFIVEHFKNHPKEKLESWKILEIISLNSLSKLFNNIDHQLPEKNVIAKDFGVHNAKYLVSWFNTICLIRNIIAHHGRLWNKTILTKYDWPKNNMLKNPILNYIPDNFKRRKLFPLISALVYLSNNIENNNHPFKKNIIQLFLNYPNIPLYKMGFPKNWKEQPIWQ